MEGSSSSAVGFCAVYAYGQERLLEGRTEGQVAGFRPTAAGGVFGSSAGHADLERLDLRARFLQASAVKSRRPDLYFYY